MSTATTQVERTAIPGLRELYHELRTWLEKNLRAAVITAIIGYAVAYLGNVWLMAVVYDGAQKVPPGGPASGEGNVVIGSLFWGLITTVSFGVFGYWRAVGSARFRRELIGLPGALLSLVRQDGTAGRIHLLWGAAASLLATQLVSPAVGAVLAVGLLASMPGLIGRVLSSLAMRLWSQLLQRVAPTRRRRAASILMMSVGILGASVAMLLGVLLPGDVGGFPTRLIVAAACGGAAILIARGQPPGPALLLLLLGTGAAALVDGLVHPLLVHANDGGVAECGVSWTQWLTQCEGRSNVLVHAAAGGLGAAAGAPLGLGLGALSALGSGGDAGVDDGGGDEGEGGGGGDGVSGPIPDPPPVPHFPHVFMRGNQVVIECANGVVLSAPLNPDGSVGEWSATNLRTESGGAVDSRITNDDGSVTTYYSNGSVDVRGPGGYTSWGADGTETVVGGDGTAQTFHPDGSVDVRSPDGTVDTTFPDGTTVHTEPDGTTTTENPDGTTTVHHPDGSADQTTPDGTRIHQSGDGTVTTVQPDGTETVQSPDGMSTTTLPDGSTATRWPDGSGEFAGADGTLVTTSPDGSRVVHEPDGTVITVGPDGSAVVVNRDGTRVTESADGTVTTVAADGTSTTTSPGGFALVHRADGTVEAIAPDGTSLGNPMETLNRIDGSLGYAQEYPNAADAAGGLLGQVQSLIDKVRAQGGAFTPADLAALMWLQNAQNQISNAISNNIAVDQQAFSAQQMAQLLARENADPSTLHDIGGGVMESYNQQVQGLIDRQEEYIRTHLSDLPVSEWGQVESVLDQVNASSPNPASLDRLQQLSHAIFNQEQTGSADGSAISRLVTVATPPPAEPQLSGDALVRDLIGKQQDFLINHMDELSSQQAARIHDLLDRTGGSASTADLALLQQYSHSVFDQLQGRSESSAAQAQMDAIDAESHRVMSDRLGKLAAGTEAVIMAPLMVSGAVGMVSAGGGAWVAGALAPVTLPGAAAAAGQLGAFYLGSNAIKGAAAGYFGGSDPDPTRRILYGVAEATLPVNTINAYNALAEGKDVSNLQIGLAVLQDLGNVAQIHGAAENLGELARAQGGAAGLIDRLSGKPPSDAMQAMDAGAIADRTAGQAKVTELQEAMLQAHNDDAYLAARERLDRLQTGLANDPNNPALPGRIRDAQAALDALPAQQRLNQAATELVGDYQGKNILKQTPMEIQQAYNQQLAPIVDRVDQRFVQAMNDSGLQRGGRPFTQADLVDLRNASSVTAGMDRDLALNEMYARQLQSRVDALPPGSPQAHDLQMELNQVRAQSQITAPVLDTAGNPVIGADGNVVRQRISPSDWQDRAQQLYNGAFKGVTGQEAGPSLQQITQSKNIEAYPDLNVLRNDPANYPFDPGHADAIGGVTSVKSDNAARDLSPWNASQETARGTAKDISTKLEPLLMSKGADPAKLAEVQEARDFLKSYGDGNMLPSQANAYAQQHFGTDVRGLCDRVSASMTVAIKWNPAATTPAMSGAQALAGAEAIPGQSVSVFGATHPSPQDVAAQQQMQDPDSQERR